MLKSWLRLILYFAFIESNVCHAQVVLDSYQIYPLNASYEGAEAVLPLFQQRCIELYGDGSVFYGHPILSSQEYDEESQSYNSFYDVAISCNGCKGSFFEEKKNKVEEECNKKCLRLYDVQCFSRGWGADDNGTLKCSDEMDYSLTGCSESSSSENEDSSSSEEQSSSSMESSSSDTRSSSSANGSSDSGATLSSTESGSSSGVVCEDGPCSGSSSSGAGATLEHCYQGAPGSCMFIGDYFFEIPRMLQPIVLPSNQIGRCREGKYAVQTNIPILIGYEYYCADDAGCSGPLHKKIAYSCVAAEGERTVEQGCMYDDGVPLYGRDGSSFAVVMLGKKGLIEVSSVWSASRHPTPAVFDTKELLDAVRQTYGDPEYLADSCAKLFSPQSSSQGCEEDPDSPYPCEESSSSSDIESSSSSETESSSSEGESSSSAGCFVSGVDQVYSPEQVFNDCLENMEPGKCYSLNPDRGVQTGWISSNAQDSWWWRVVDCGTGERVDSNKVGVCPGFPLERVPSNPESACFAYNGSCYKCNPDRGSECSNSWLWQGSFTPANIGWWYEEVDCDDPFEDDFDQCNADGALLKRNNHSETKYMDVVPYVLSESRNNYFDALGRIRKKSNLIKIYNVDVTPIRIRQGSTIVSGHTRAYIDIKWNVCKQETYDDKNLYIIDVLMETSILHEFKSNNPLLQAHEDRHKEIYMDSNLAFGYWPNHGVEISRKIKKRREKCKLIVDSFWDIMPIAIKWKLQSLFSEQNRWDYQDDNNAGHLSYPNIDKTIDSMYNVQLERCRP